MNWRDLDLKAVYVLAIVFFVFCLVFWEAPRWLFRELQGKNFKGGKTKTKEERGRNGSG